MRSSTIVLKWIFYFFLLCLFASYVFKYKPQPLIDCTQISNSMYYEDISPHAANTIITDVLSCSGDDGLPVETLYYSLNFDSNGLVDLFIKTSSEKGCR